MFSYNFGDIGIDSIKSISFTVPLFKTSLLDRAILNYLKDDESYLIKSNILKNI